MHLSYFKKILKSFMISYEDAKTKKSQRTDNKQPFAHHVESTMTNILLHVVYLLTNPSTQLNGWIYKHTMHAYILTFTILFLFL